MPIIQENPTYFTDRVQPIELNQVHYKKSGFNDSNKPRSKSRGPLSSDDTDNNEIEVFLSSFDSNRSTFMDNGMLSSIDSGRETSFTNSNSSSSNGSCSTGQTKTSKVGLGQKIGQLFWKSRSKNSVGSESQGSQASGSTMESGCGGLYSPRFTPDSSLSICTSSIEGDSANSNSSNSNQISPKNGNQENKDTPTVGLRLINDQTVCYRFDDCEKYAANMYYNMGEGSSYTFAVQQQQSSRPRNNSVPIAATKDNKNTREMIGLTEMEDCVEPYYNNTTFSTFPNPRRHSIAYSSGSSSNSGTEKRGKSKQYRHNQDQVIEQDGDGYLRPNEPRNLRNVKNLYYINDPIHSPSHEESLNGSRVQVHVDVHTPTSSSLNSTEFDGQDSPKRLTSLETSAATTDDSQSTVVASSAALNYLPGCSTPDNSRDGFNNRTTGNGISKSPGTFPDSKKRDKILPMYMSRILSAGTDCEPYCSLCASTTMLASTSKKTKMDVAIVSCQDCFFSKNAETHIRGFFDKLVTTEKQRMDVILQSYDLKQLDLPTMAADVHRSKVQIVIISHHFLQRLKMEATTRVRLSPVNRVFRSKRVIAVLVGVDEKEILDGFEGVLARFTEWFHVELKSTSKLDPEFCKKFTEQVVKIYNLELCNTSNFSVFPKKITRDQPKIFMSFKKALTSTDNVQVEFTCGRKVETLTGLRMENPYTILLKVPGSLSPEKTALVEIGVFINNKKIGTTWVKWELQKSYDEDVIERMGAMIPEFLKLLDDHISKALSRNFRDCTDHTTDPAMELMNDVLICKGDEFPTIMHFAAHYGLERTVWALLDESDGIEQCGVFNDNNDIPSDIAKLRGHDNIFQVMSDYQEIISSMKAYKYIQGYCHRASVMNLGKRKIVSTSKSSLSAVEESVSSYENVQSPTEIENPDIIAEEHDPDLNLPESNTASNEELDRDDVHTVDYENANNVIDEQENDGVHYEKVVYVTESSDISPESKPQKPIPVARSPRKPKTTDYFNVSEATREAENPEHVNRRPNRNRFLDQNRNLKPLLPTYDIPRLINADYSIPPSIARPVLPKKPARADNTPVLHKKVAGTIPTKDGYLIMDIEQDRLTGSSMKDSDESDFDEQPKLRRPRVANGFNEALPASDLPRFEKMSPVRKESTQKSAVSNEASFANQARNDLTNPVDVEEELKSIMKEFPNNGYTMRQIEVLFDNWKSRPDVTRSVEEKKKYLSALREDYKRIQQQAASNSRKPSPLERIKVLITGRKKSLKVSRMLSKESLESEKGTENGYESPSLDKHEDPWRTSAEEGLSERGSFGSSSHSQDSGGSNQDSGVSESDSRFSERANSTSKSVGPSGVKELTWSNPMSRRFCPSYIGPDIATGMLGDSTSNVVKSNSSPLLDVDHAYQIPPPARPVTGSPVGTRKPDLYGAALGPPPPPKKSSHVNSQHQQSVNEFDNPPPPPPRSYKPPNQFNYIDYKQKSRNVTASETQGQSGAAKPAYDNIE